MSDFIAFGDIWSRAMEIVNGFVPSLSSAGVTELYFIRDLTGRIRIAIPEQETEQVYQGEVHPISALAVALYDGIKPHAYAPSQGVLHVASNMLTAAKQTALVRTIHGLTIYLVDRLVTGNDWARVYERQCGPADCKPAIFTMYAVKGGMGRTTTAAVLATHLATQGLRVLVIDLDLESPGLSGLLLSPPEHPDFGIADWFVEDMVGQGDYVLHRMMGRPSWSQDFRGDVIVVPAYGRDPSDFLAKLGRVYMDRPSQSNEPPESWSHRLSRLLKTIEANQLPDVVLLDARSGLHDLAAAVITDIASQVFMFAVDSNAAWTGYRILFEHWQRHAVATKIRDRLSLVASMVPDTGADAYLSKLREHSWDLFREFLYDELPAGGDPDKEVSAFSFDLADEAGPHSPLPILWNRGLAALSSLETLEWSVVMSAYEPFLRRFDALLDAVRGDRP